MTRLLVVVAVVAVWIAAAGGGFAPPGAAAVSVAGTGAQPGLSVGCFGSPGAGAWR